MSDDEEHAGEESDVEMHDSVTNILQEPEVTYAIKNSRRTLLQEAAKEHPDWTFADLRARYGENGQRANSQMTHFVSKIAPALGGCSAIIKSKKCGQAIAWGCLVRFYCKPCFAFHQRSKRANCTAYHSQNLMSVVQSRAARAKLMGDVKSENLKRRRSAQAATPAPSRPSKRPKSTGASVSTPSLTPTIQGSNVLPFSAVWAANKAQFNARFVPLPMGALSLAAQPRSETFVSEIVKNLVGGAHLTSADFCSLNT